MPRDQLSPEIPVEPQVLAEVPSLPSVHSEIGRVSRQVTELQENMNAQFMSFELAVQASYVPVWTDGCVLGVFGH